MWPAALPENSSATARPAPPDRKSVAGTPCAATTSAQCVYPSNGSFLQPNPSQPVGNSVVITVVVDKSNNHGNRRIAHLSRAIVRPW